MAWQSVVTGCLIALFAPVAFPQDFTQRGFVETRGILYPQKAANDSGRFVGESLFRYEANYRIIPFLRFNGSIEARSDSHRQVDRRWRLDLSDRGLQRPAFSIRRLSAIYNRGKLTVELGKQFIRWGKADILNPTDRFAPKDFLSVVDTDFLAVTAARASYEAGSNTLDFIWQPRFTPSRTPLLNQRWTVLPEAASAIAIVDVGSRFPGDSQLGARWNHIGSGFEYSLCFFDGYNHLPLFDTKVEPFPLRATFQHFYPRLRLYGADAAVPLRWFTVKAETAYFTSRTKQADEYLLYVIQLERQSGEWSFVGGYSGEAVTSRKSPIEFAPDRGLTRAFLGRAGYTIDANRDVSIQTAIRQNGQGTWVRAEYSQLFGQHWRATTGFSLICGEAGDFLGQYRRNSHAILALRYSF